MSSIQLFSSPVVHALGWALLHLLWQATIVAGILAAALALIPRENASARYTAACSALAVVFLLFVVTTMRSWEAAPVAYNEPDAQVSASVPLSELPALIAGAAATSGKEFLVTRAQQSIPTLVAIWFSGVLLLSLRLLVSWTRIRRSAGRQSRPAGREYQLMASRLSEALGLPRAVTLLESSAVVVPSVIGWLRPVVLLPASTLTGLTPAQIEMILAHELAHIRRHDFAVNLLQAFVETLMFYHPAVWWISSRVRVERENCCDDLALGICADRIEYARALARLEELRAAMAPLTVAATGGSLLDRIRRIAGIRPEAPAWGARWAAAVALLAGLAFALAIPSTAVLAQRDASEASVEVTALRVDADENDDERSASVEIEDDYLGDEMEFDFEALLERPLIPDPPAIPAAPVIPFPDLTPMAIAPPLPNVPLAIAPPAPSPRGLPIASLAPPAPVASPRARAVAPPAPRRRVRLSGEEQPTVEDLIALRAVGVTPARIEALREALGDLTLDEVMELSAVGVTPAYVKELRAAGFETSPPLVLEMKAVGVTTDYIAAMRSIYPRLSAHEMVEFRAVGVTPAYLREMTSAGFQITSPGEAVELKAVGVTPSHVSDFRALFPGVDLGDISGLRAVGVTPGYVRELRASGVTINNADDATTLKALGVTPAFVRKLASAGYTNLSTHELIGLAAAGIDDEFIRDMAKYRNSN
ncbi:MAG TPA: M56 family metallopeptidase [Thermoanaerobaculia bacterium]